jgi:hypothetical protein
MMKSLELLIDVFKTGKYVAYKDLVLAVFEVVKALVTVLPKDEVQQKSTLSDEDAVKYLEELKGEGFSEKAVPWWALSLALKLISLLLK